MASKSEAMTKVWADPKRRARQSEWATKYWTPARRRWLSRHHKRNGVRPVPSRGSVRLKRVLGRGWKLEHWVTFKWPIRYGIDIAHPVLKIAIEVDGRSHRNLRRQEFDRRRNAHLRKLGWTVFRVSEEGCRLL